MGKKTITGFIYDGSMDYYVRIPHANTGGVWKLDTYTHRYFPKREYSFQDVLDWRMKTMIELEANGKRGKTRNGCGKWHTAEKFAKEEASGMYAKFFK